MKKPPSQKKGTPDAAHLPAADPVSEMRKLNDETVKVVALLNSDLQPTGINQYEMLRRIVREDDKLKAIYRGVVNPGKVVSNAIQVFAKRASSEAGATGGTRLDDVLKEASPQKVLDEIIKDILPAVISNHVQSYMEESRRQLR